MKHPLGFAGHVHYLTHHVREQGTLRLEEAIRKMTSMPAAHFGLWDRGLLRAGLQRRRRGVRLGRARRRLDARESDRVRTRDRARPRQRRPRRRRRRAHGRSAGPSPARGDTARSTSAPTCTRRRRTRCGTRCARRSSAGRRYGEDPSVNELQERMAGLLGKEAALWVPTCGMANLVALLTIAPRGSTVVLEASSHVLTSEAMGIEEIAGLEPWSLWAEDGRLDPAEVEEADRRDGRADARAREHAHAGGRHRPLAGADGRAGRGGAAPRRVRPSRRGAALQRRGRPRRPGAGARGAGEHGGGQPEQGPLRADGDDPRRPHAGDRARARDAAPARRRERAQGRASRPPRRSSRSTRSSSGSPTTTGGRASSARCSRRSRASRSSRPRSRRTSCSSTSAAPSSIPDEFLRLLAERGVLGLERDTTPHPLRHPPPDRRRRGRARRPSVVADAVTTAR